MDILQRKYYEQKVERLVEEIEKATKKKERINMDELMRSIGLSPKLKERAETKADEIEPF